MLDGLTIHDYIEIKPVVACISFSLTDLI